MPHTGVLHKTKIFIGYQNGSISISATLNLQMLQIIKAHNLMVTRILASQHEILTSSYDSTVKFWKFNK